MTIRRTSYSGLVLGLSLGLALAAAGGARADDAIDGAGRVAQSVDQHFAQQTGDGPRAERHPMVHDAGEAGGERVVKGAPYCAEAVHETVQWLADGSGGAPNRIVRQQTTLLCRDGEGRTRQEVQRGDRRLVFLRDPVARERWTLDIERKVARRTDLHGSLVDGGAWHEYGERMREWARAVADKARGSAASQPAQAPVPPAPPIGAMPPMPPVPVVISRPEGAPREVQVVRIGGEGGADWALPPPAVQWRAQSWAPRGAGSVSPLGGKDIDGIRANGERTTWVIEAGKVGNEKPIQITREVWTAPDLMITLSSRDFDPRSGEVNYRLRNLRRGEPDAALMRVPADYKIPAGSGGKTPGATGQG